jgi:hypothetical protein
MTRENPAMGTLMRNPTQNRRDSGSRRFAVAACPSMGFAKWAWVELNYRPHAYQPPQRGEDQRPPS